METVARALISKTKHQFPYPILEEVGDVILQIEAFLIQKEHFTQEERDDISGFSFAASTNLQEYITRRLGEVATLCLTSIPNPSDSKTWRSWLSRFLYFKFLCDEC
jgi:hypothetical protein